MWATAAPSSIRTSATTAELREALGGLPADQRRALLLAALFGFTAREIGEIEQIPLGTAKTRIRTAMQKLAAADAGDERGRRGRGGGTADERRRLRAAARDRRRARARDRRRRGPRLGARPPRRLRRLPRPDRAALGARRRAAAARARRSSRPPGFEERVVAADPAAGAAPRALRAASRSRASPRVAAAACAAAAVWFALGDDRDLADSYRETLAVANGEYFDAAPIELAGRRPRSATSTATRAAPRGCWRSSTTGRATAATSSRCHGRRPRAPLRALAIGDGRRQRRRRDRRSTTTSSPRSACSTRTAARSPTPTSRLAARAAYRGSTGRSA